jgi:hypothetical protein
MNTEIWDVAGPAEPVIRSARVVSMPAHASHLARDCPDAPNRRGFDVWCYRGAVLHTDDNGEVLLDELQEFVTWVRKQIPGARLLLHRYGLRAIDMDGKGGGGGPHLDWRDWD